MKPITAVVKEKGGAVTYPSNQEVTLNADGSGGPVYNNSPAQFGPQGLGRKGNNGYEIGSPSKKTTRSEKIMARSEKNAYEGRKAVDEGRNKRADRLLKRAARQEDRAIRIEEKAKSPAKCWSGYKRVPGTKKGAKGSCKKK